MEEKNKGGRPPKYTEDDVELMQKKIDDYFAWCDGEMLEVDGQPVLDKYGMPIMIKTHPYTMTGLALALGLKSRQALLNYQGRPEFNDTITQAKAKVEQYAEERLFDKDGANGAKFSLSNNFSGWREKQQIEADVNQSVNINIALEDDE